MCIRDSQAGGEAERLRQVEQIMLRCLARQIGSKTPLRVSKVVQNGEVVENDYMVSSGGRKVKLWKVACPECGNNVGPEKVYLGLTGGLTGERSCSKCAARLLVAETSPRFVSPAESATATPTVSVLSLKPVQGAE